jgi:hypothetical protein
VKSWVKGRNIEECSAQVHARSTMVEKGIYEIGRIGRLKKQNEDAMNSRTVEARIGEGRGRWLMRSRNVEKCRQRSKTVSRKITESRKREMKVAPGVIPSKNKIVDAKITEGSERSENFEEAQKKLDWIKECVTAKDRWK